MDTLNCQHWCIKYAPWVMAGAMAVLVLLLARAQLVDRAVTDNKLQASVQFGDHMLLTIGEYSKVCR